MAHSKKYAIKINHLIINIMNDFGISGFANSVKKTIKIQSLYEEGSGFIYSFEVVVSSLRLDPGHCPILFVTYNLKSVN